MISANADPVSQVLFHCQFNQPQQWPLASLELQFEDVIEDLNVSFLFLHTYVKIVRGQLVLYL